MSIRILAIGDVTTQSGVSFLEKHLNVLKKQNSVDFTIVNGENASGLGLTPGDAERIYNAGADVITLGNHSFSRREILSYIEDDRYMLRPENMVHMNPGRGYGIFDAPRGYRVGVINLMGRVSVSNTLDNPFFVADRVLKELDTPIIMVDFHAEATSEKAGLARYLDGRVSALFGTHTHVQTADECILPGGTGFITDLGMTGPVDSILGMDVDESIRRLIGAPPGPYRPAKGPCRICGAIFDVSDSGRCVGVSRVAADVDAP